MAKTLSDAIDDLKSLGGKQNLPPAEILKQVIGALQAVDARLAALEKERQSASAPISDTPQGENAPLSR